MEMCRSRRYAGCVGLLVSAALMVLAVPARAEDVAAARAHYEKGTALFDLQKFAEAAAEYEAAYEAKRDPAFLYNIGQAYRQAGNPSKALWAYRAYLKRMPKTPRRAEVEQRITEMIALEEEAKRNPMPPSPEPASPEPASGATVSSPAVAPLSTATVAAQPAAPEKASPRRLKIAGLITGGVGLALLGAGIGLEVVAQQRLDAFNRPVAGAVFDPGAQSDMNTMHGLGLGFIITGGVAVIAGGTAFILGTRRGRAIVNKVLQ